MLLNCNGEASRGPLVWIKLMGSRLSRLVVSMCTYNPDRFLESDVLQVSCCGGFDCPIASNSFCSWFSFLYYHNRFDKMDKEH